MGGRSAAGISATTFIQAGGHSPIAGEPEDQEEQDVGCISVSLPHA